MSECVDFMRMARGGGGEGESAEPCCLLCWDSAQCAKKQCKEFHTLEVCDSCPIRKKRDTNEVLFNRAILYFGVDKLMRLNIDTAYELEHAFALYARDPSEQRRLTVVNWLASAEVFMDIAKHIFVQDHESVFSARKQHELTRIKTYLDEKGCK